MYGVLGSTQITDSQRPKELENKLYKLTSKYPGSGGRMVQTIGKRMISDILFAQENTGNSSNDTVEKILEWLGGINNDDSPFIRLKLQLDDIKAQNNVLLEKFSNNFNSSNNDQVNRDDIIQYSSSNPIQTRLQGTCLNYNTIHNVYFILYIYILSLFNILASKKLPTEIFSIENSLHEKIEIEKSNEVEQIIKMYNNQCRNLLNSETIDNVHNVNKLLFTYKYLIKNKEIIDKTKKDNQKLLDDLKAKTTLDKRKAHYENIELRDKEKYLKIIKYIFWIFFVVYALFVIVLLKEDNRYVKAFLVGKMLIWGLFLDDSIYYSKLLYDFIMSFIPIDVFKNL